MAFFLKSDDDDVHVIQCDGTSHTEIVLYPGNNFTVYHPEACDGSCRPAQCGRRRVTAVLERAVEKVLKSVPSARFV